MTIPEIICRKAEDLLPLITTIRRDLHQHPELSFEEYRTAGLIADQLLKLGLKVQSGIAKTGVVGLLEGKYPGKTFAIRADMDALAISEQNTHEFKSLNPGIGHLCGHDGHITNALGVAMVLADVRHELRGNVKFIFQPAEEVFPPGGANEMVKEGVLNNPDVDGIVMLHVAPGLSLGKISVKYGAVTGTSNEFIITITGKGGHGAMPHLSVDPIVIACQLAVALQTIISRNVNPVQPAVLSIGSIHSGSVHNAIPETAIINGTVRSTSFETRELIRTQMEKMSVGIVRAMGGSCTFSFIENCAATVNADQMTDALIKAGRATIGKENIIITDEIHLWTEDFSVYANKVPGVLFLLGIAEDDPEKDFPLHHPRFNFDESALVTGIKVISQMAVDFLNG